MAWDAAPLEYTGFPHRPEGDSESEGEAGEDMDTTDLQEVVVCMGKGGVHVRLDDWFLEPVALLAIVFWLDSFLYMCEHYPLSEIKLVQVMCKCKVFRMHLSFCVTLNIVLFVVLNV